MAIRAAIIASNDPRPETYWSGLGQQMCRALDRHFDLVHIESQPYPRWHQFMVRVVLKLTGGRVDIGWSKPWIRFATRGMRQRVKAARPDVVLALSAGEPTLVMDPAWTIINFADATGPLLENYYGWYKTLHPRRMRAINRGSLESIARCQLSIYSSAWAAEGARRDCQLGEDRVVEIPFGANIALDAPAPVRTLSQPLRLLFVGYDWERKGGPLACAAVRQLVSEGCQVQFDVVGCDRPADEPASEAIRFHGRINKADPAQFATLKQLYDQAHLFVMPSHAECFGCVFAEAAAYGLPSVALRTGGVPTAIQHGISGWLLDPTASPADLAAAIRHLTDDPARYAAMSQAALDDAAQRLNWHVWGTRVEQEVTRVLATRKG